MKKSSAIPGVAAAVGMLPLILDSKTALLGAREGIGLCIKTVIPSLFPFIVLSGLVTGSLSGRKTPFLRWLSRLTGIPAGAESILLTGFLGGYPLGAQLIGAAQKSGTLHPRDAWRMLAFCSNAGPAFLFGMAASVFPRLWMGWALWGIHIVSALLVALLLPGKSRNTASPSPGNPPGISDALSYAVRTMGTICGWVVLFRVLIVFLDRWFGWLPGENLRIALTGLLELSNGCCALGSVENLGLRFVLCAAMLAFGGLCVTMQTVTVAQDTDISLYLPGKLLQTLFSVFFALLVQLLFPEESRLNGLWITLPALVLVFLPLGIKKRKISSIPAKLGV